MAINLGNIIKPIGNTYRGIFSSWFNGRNIAKEDFQRQIQMQNYANEFNAEQAVINREFEAAEAEKNRVWQTEMSNTQIQRQVEDMKSAGINPIMALGNSGASVGSAGVASGSTAQASNSMLSSVYHNDPASAIVSTVARVGLAVLLKKLDAGLITKGTFKIGF